MCGGGPSAPAPPPRVPIAVKSQPKLADEGVRKAQSDTRDKARQFAGTRSGTLVTGAGGLTTDANTTKKTLLGA